MTINPCRVCGAIPFVGVRGGASHRWWQTEHMCVSPMHGTEEAAVTAWNRDNPPDDKAQAGQGEG